MTFEEWWEGYTGSDKDKSLVMGKVYAQSAWDYQQARIEALKEALLEAAEEIDDWGQYAGEYFMKKHDLAGTVKRFKDLAEQEE